MTPRPRRTVNLGTPATPTDTPPAPVPDTDDPEVLDALNRLRVLGYPGELRPTGSRTWVLEYLAAEAATQREWVETTGRELLKERARPSNSDAPRLESVGLRLMVVAFGRPVAALLPDTGAVVVLADYRELWELCDEVAGIAGRLAAYSAESEPPPGIDLADVRVEHQRARDELATALLEVLRPGKPAPRRRRKLPDALPQTTAPEVRVMSVAVSDMTTLRRWSPVSGEVAWFHAIPGESLQVKFEHGRLDAWWDAPTEAMPLGEWLQRMEFAATMLLNVCIALVRHGDGVCDIDLDALMARIGWKPDGRAERDAMRHKLWRWLNVLAATSVIGMRRGTWKDPKTGKVYDLATRDPLLTFSVPEVSGTPAQMSLDPGAPPPAVTLYAGGMLARFKNNRSVLTDYGDVLALGSISSRQAAGRWAQGIGLALQQQWRNRAGRSSERRNPYTFTRRALLDLHRPLPHYDELLEGLHPTRARTYWDDAIGLLRTRRLIGADTAGKGTAPTRGRDWPRQGWADQWLDEPITIEPPASQVEASALIAESADHRRRQATRRPRKARASPK